MDISATGLREQYSFSVTYMNEGHVNAFSYSGLYQQIFSLFFVRSKGPLGGWQCRSGDPNDIL